MLPFVILKSKLLVLFCLDLPILVLDWVFFNKTNLLGEKARIVEFGESQL